MTKSYDNPWLFNNKPFNTEDIGQSVGFVYVIISPATHKSYIGRKYFFSFRKKKGATRRSKAESNWKVYYGSNQVLLEEIKEHGKENYKRVILSLHTTKGDKYYNDNINGKWYRKPDHIVKGRILNEHFRF